uniref:Uncharacterized protein n=1 Tax=Opuntia streptacantha TaxID=393608 RepID=A0A7C9EML4_OPUST
MGWPWWLWPDGSIILRTLHFGTSLWSVCFALDLPLWAYWASFSTSLDLVWPQYLYFLLTFGSTCVNLQSKLEKAKIERNRRNMCINSKIVQINPKIEFKSLKIPIHI